MIITANNKANRPPYAIIIGGQVWQQKNYDESVTPAGNVIANVTEDGAVEKNIDSGFDTTVGWTVLYPTILNITGGKLMYSGTVNSMPVNRPAVFTAGKYYKITINVLSGTARIGLYGTSSFIIPITNYSTGTTTKIVKALTSGNKLNIYVYNISGGTAFEVESLSVQELNWSNATEIYDAVYAATSGTADEKEYAALKEAAMWCYYNNDAALGRVYGKLYNWYAAKLLDLDMASSGYGWRVPTDAQSTTLATALGGESVAGGKMKAAGFDYWNSPNTGATNESGFTALGAGFRFIDGTFDNIGNDGIWWSATELNTSNAWRRGMGYDNSNLLRFSSNKVLGFSVRLIKNS